jgi:hypothetical protein
MRDLYNLLEPSRLTSVVDVGSNPIDGRPAYTRMREEGLCTVVGFDPQMSAEPRQGVDYRPTAIGNGSRATLHICQQPGMTSLLPPNMDICNSLPGFAEGATVVERKTIETTRLDDTDVEIDLLCMDVQGSESDVLTYGRKKLRYASAIITEVSFMPLYKGQEVFGSVDLHLREMGFIPHCFASAKVWPVLSKVQVPKLDPHQMLEADIVYVRDFTRPATMNVQHWKQLALISHHVLGSVDLAMHCIERLVEREAVTSEAPALYRQILERM